MRSLRRALVPVVVLATAACAHTHPGTAGGSAYSDCAQKSAVVAHADLDGDGSTEAVLLGTGKGRCAESLLAEVHGRMLGVHVGSTDLSPRAADVLHLRGPGPDLVVLRAGDQPHVFGLDGTGLAELTAAGGPLLPKVPANRRTSPTAVTCTPDGGLALLTTRAHQPPGIVLAWDVTRTTYAVRHGTAVRRGSKRVAEAVADPVLHKRMPELYDDSLFQGCG